jgi:hypothetical protein
MDELKLDEAQKNTRNWISALDLISGIRFYQIQYTFYQFTYLAKALKIQLVLGVFIEKYFLKKLWATS